MRFKVTARQLRFLLSFQTLLNASSRPSRCRSRPASCLRGAARRCPRARGRASPHGSAGRRDGSLRAAPAAHPQALGGSARPAATRGSAPRSAPGAAGRVPLARPPRGCAAPRASVGPAGFPAARHGGPAGCAYLSSRRAQNTSFVRGEAAGSAGSGGGTGRALGASRRRLSSRRRLPAESRAAPPSPGPYEAPCDPLTARQPRPPPCLRRAPSRRRGAARSTGRGGPAAPPRAARPAGARGAAAPLRFRFSSNRGEAAFKAENNSAAGTPRHTRSRSELAGSGLIAEGSAGSALGTDMRASAPPRGCSESRPPKPALQKHSPPEPPLATAALCPVPVAAGGGASLERKTRGKRRCTVRRVAVDRAGHFPATNHTCTHKQTIKEGKADQRKHCRVSHANLCLERAFVKQQHRVQPSGTDPQCLLPTYCCEELSEQHSATQTRAEAARRAPSRAVPHDALLSSLLRERQELMWCSGISLARVWYGVLTRFCCQCSH